jgi:Tfp pilus assembly protein PilN
MDFNFFEPYMRVSAKPDSRRFLYIILALVVIALLVYYQLYLMASIHAAQSEIDEITTYLASSDVQTALDRVSQKQDMADGMNQTLDQINQTAAAIDANNLIDEMLLEKINAQVPEGLFLSDLTLNDDLLSLKGYALKYDLVAQFAYNLRMTGGFQEIVIPSVKSEDGRYVYSINANVIKEGTNEY